MGFGARMALAESLGVLARMRPAEPGDEAAEASVVLRNARPAALRLRNLEFALDWVFEPHASQAEVFEVAAQDRVAAVVEGCNATLLAYGQTVRPPMAAAEQSSHSQPSLCSMVCRVQGRPTPCSALTRS